MNPLPTRVSRYCTDLALRSLAIVLLCCLLGVCWLFATELLPDLVSEKRDPWRTDVVIVEVSR